MRTDVVLATDFKTFPLFRRGKVRDVYSIGDELLIVSTDRISCFDVVLSDGIPDKGAILTRLSCFWFEFLKDAVPNHFITADVKRYPPETAPYARTLSGRSMLVKKSRALPVECIVRGYLAGSGWKEYCKTQSICGIKLPAGLAESAKLPEVIFTPSTKAEQGHDVNVSGAYVADQLGSEVAKKIQDLSIAVYTKAAGYAEKKGIIIADTKFEFGIHEGRIILIDEVLTPDSSRFWPKDLYRPGSAQPSFDKQFVRDYLETLDWDKTPPAPVLPDEIIARTAEKYREAYMRLTGKKF